MDKILSKDTIKNVFAALGAKTSDSNYGVALLDKTSGEPKGFMGMSDLASVLGASSNLVAHDLFSIGISTDDMTTELASKILVQICAQKPGITHGEHIGTFDAGAKRSYIISVYNTSTVNNDGVPEYAFGIVYSRDKVWHIGSWHYSVSWSRIDNYGTSSLSELATALGAISPLGTLSSSNTIDLNTIDTTSIIAFTNATTDKIQNMPNDVSQYGYCITICNTGDYNHIQQWVDFQTGKQYVRNKYVNTWYGWQP